MEYTVYLRTNTVNGMQYVGQTSDFKRRERDWRCLKWTYANDYLSNDRVKYGLDNWTVETLAETDNREDAWELEQRFINDYNTLWPNGYNLSTGGAGSKGCKPSDETKQKISEAKKGENHPKYWLGKHRSTEDKQKISEALKGKKQTKEHIENRAEAHKKQVFQYTLDGKLVAIWPSAKDAEEELGIDRSSISKCCKGKLKSAGGFRWSYFPL